MDVGSLRLREDCVACCELDRPDGRRAHEGQQPCLARRLKTPTGHRRENDPLKHKMRVGYQQRSLIGQVSG